MGLFVRCKFWVVVGLLILVGVMMVKPGEAQVKKFKPKEIVVPFNKNTRNFLGAKKRRGASLPLRYHKSLLELPSEASVQKRRQNSLRFRTSLHRSLRGEHHIGRNYSLVQRKKNHSSQQSSNSSDDSLSFTANTGEVSLTRPRTGSKKTP